MNEKNKAIKFKLEQPVEGKFDFGDFKEPYSGTSTGRDGEEFEWHMYKFIDTAGEQQVFFPSKGLQKTLSEAGNLNGRTFKITKVIAKDEDGNIMEDKKGTAINKFDVELGDAPKVSDEAVPSADEVGFPPDLSQM